MEKECKEKSLGYLEHVTGTELNLGDQRKLSTGRE